MWNKVTPPGFKGAVRHTAAFIRPNRVVRDLSGLPAVLGRFGPFEVRLATTSREISKAQRLRFKVFFEEGPATPQQSAALTRRDICPFDKICDHLLVIDKDQLNRFGRKKPKIVGVYRLLRGDTAAATKAFTARRNSMWLHCWRAIPASAFWNSRHRTWVSREPSVPI